MTKEKNFVKLQTFAELSIVLVLQVTQGSFYKLALGEEQELQSKKEGSQILKAVSHNKSINGKKGGEEIEGWPIVEVA